MQLIILALLLLITNVSFAGITYDGTNGRTGVTTMGSFGTGLDTNYFCISQYIKSSTTGTSMATWGLLNTGSTTGLRVFVNLSPTDGTTVSSGKIYVYRRAEDGAVRAGGVNSNTGITNGSWHNLIVCMGSNSSPVIYVDGVSQTITDLTSNNANNMANFGFEPYISGYNSRGTLTNPFNGTITETAVWSSTALPSAGDVTTLNTHTRGQPLLVSTLNGLGGYWKMNDGTSGSANSASVADFSGNSNTGTNSSSGTTWYDDSDLFTNAATLNIGKQMTINGSLYVK